MFNFILKYISSIIESNPILVILIISLTENTPAALYFCNRQKSNYYFLCLIMFSYVIDLLIITLINLFLGKDDSQENNSKINKIRQTINKYLQLNNKYNSIAKIILCIYRFIPFSRFPALIFIRKLEKKDILILNFIGVLLWCTSIKILVIVFNYGKNII